MPLRMPNTPTTDVAIMQVLANLLPNDPTSGLPNTQLGVTQASTGLTLVYVQNKYKMSLIMTTTTPSAVHLASGQQTYQRNSLHTYMGLCQIVVGYYSRWDQQDESIDGIRRDIAADLERMRANIENNDSLSYQGQNYAISIPMITLSPYKGEFDTTFPGLTLVYREMILNVNVLPYYC